MGFGPCPAETVTLLALIEGLCIIYQIGLGDAPIKPFSLDSAVLLCLLICWVVKLLSKYPRVHLHMCSELGPQLFCICGAK